MSDETTPTTTPTLAPTSSPLDLWLTDRSHFKVGISRCPRARYLGYHAGPTGYGFTARREALPLVTGIAVHQILEACARILQRFDRLPDLVEMREMIGAITRDYLGRVDARGYRGILGGPQTEETIVEQCALVAGLAWVLRLKFLPWLHAQYKVVRVEEERLHMLGEGQAIMLRTDLLAERRSGHSLAYFECKTTGWESEAWAEQWETDAQLALGTVDARELWGTEVTEIYIVGLNKGRRVRDRYTPDDPRKKQQSPLCYGYRRPGNPPFASDDWLPSYEWVNPEGETKHASKMHKRAGVWLLEESDWPTWRAYQGQDPDLTPGEFWTRMLPPSVLDKICFILGPMNPQAEQLKSLLRGFEGEETRWQEALWTLYQLQQLGHTWSSPTFQAALDRLVPCSWACRPFGKDNQCEFVPVCHRHNGWDDPMANGYQARLPHHEPERVQAVARGLLPEQAETVEEEE
jgi:hypothetical protein